MPRGTPKVVAKCSVEGCDNLNDGCGGVCGTHYRRFQKYGTYDQLRRPKGKAKCRIDGCEDLDRGGLGLCHKHYMRERHHGHSGLVREGGKRNHPLYSMWHERKMDGVLSEEWIDFKRFVADVVEKPGVDFTLARTDQTKPFGPANFEWRPHMRRQPGETRKAWWARKWKSRQEANPGAERSRELRRRFGLSVEDYERMLKESGNVCAVCKQPETATTAQAGTIRRLAIDHNHTTGQLRGLLCFRCNSVVGKIEERLDLLDAIRDYLIRWNVKEAA